MRRLILGFAGRTYHIFGNYISRLIQAHTVKHLYFIGIFYLARLTAKTKKAKIWDREIQLRIQLHNKQ